MKTSAARGSLGRAGVREPARLDHHEVGRLARLQAADVVAAEAGRAAARRHPEHVLGREPARGILADAVSEQRLSRLRQHVRAVVARGAVDAQADRRPRIEERADGGDPGAETEVRGRAVGGARPRLPEQRHLVRGEVDGVRHPDVRAQPAQAPDVFDRPHAVHLEAERLLVLRLREVRVEAHSELAREVRPCGASGRPSPRRASRARARSASWPAAAGRGTRG